MDGAAGGSRAEVHEVTSLGLRGRLFRKYALLLAGLVSAERRREFDVLLATTPAAYQAYREWQAPQRASPSSDRSQQSFKPLLMISETLCLLVVLVHPAILQHVVEWRATNPN
jgi:anti-sigma factor RsiW